ncbi:DUF4160 domain-containing protein [Phyllobacterium leguminum]|uniref:DUF4160 domain-containing protein n=1 Tax=Phyllobacterium leguminum TaxID=314237 RepID=UPI000DA1B51F|nr:DUF4160 domain-containing protein [Phyllobacterium leguminum]
MPTIVEIGNVKIQVFPDDHNPPHFHVVTPDSEAVFRIADFQRLAGQVDRRALHKALAWARLNRKVLEDEWNRLNS